MIHDGETPAACGERLRAAMEASLDSLLILASERDDAGRITDFIIQDVNGRAEAMLQIPRRDLVGRRLCEVLPINRTAGFFEKYAQVAETGIPLQEEFLLPDTHVPGAWYSHQVVRCADGILITNRDITASKRAEAELWAAGARLRLALSGADLGTWDWDIPSGRVIFDERWAGMLGYHPTDLAPTLRTWSDLLHPDDLGPVTVALEAHLAGETDGYETVHRVRHRDGHWIWILDKGRVIERDADGRPRRACGTHLDITSSKQAEQELVASRAFVRATLDSLLAHVCVLDEHGVIIDVNRPWTDFAADNPPVCGNVARGADYLAICDAVVGPDALEAGAFAAGIRAVMACEIDSFQYEYPCHSPRQRRWFIGHVTRLSTGPGGPIVVSHEDITQRKLTEEHLREREELFRQFFETSVNYCYMISSDGMILDVNPATLSSLGYSREELLGGAVSAIYAPESRAQSARVFAACRSAGRVQNEELVVLTRSGERRTVLLSAGQVVDAEGHPLYLVYVQTDITNHLQIQAEKARLEAQFHQAQKLESVGRLAGGVAHDLNNLLTPILGYGELLLGDPHSLATNRAAVDEIVQAGRRARDLVRQLLAFSRKQALEFKPIDVNDMLNQFAGLLRRTIRENVVIQFETTAALPVVRGDAGQLEQVVMNLAVNAQDAMPAGGLLIVETAVEDLDGSGTEGRSGPHVRLTIRDTGSGLSAEAREHLFEPFFTTKEQGKGTGLGLATVYGIVTQHGGTIGVDSSPGRGTTFTIHLPASADMVVRGERKETSTTSTRGDETILLVEDHDQVRDLAQDILAMHGYRVLAAADGESALEITRHHTGPLHLLLTDVIMPGMSGKDLFETLSPNHPDLKVIYMSGYADEVIVHHGVLEPGLAFVQKPFEVRTLLATVRGALDQARAIIGPHANQDGRGSLR